jgi:hypothetical protein
MWRHENGPVSGELFLPIPKLAAGLSGAVAGEITPRFDRRDSLRSVYCYDYQRPEHHSCHANFAGTSVLELRMRFDIQEKAQ